MTFDKEEILNENKCFYVTITVLDINCHPVSCLDGILKVIRETIQVIFSHLCIARNLEIAVIYIYVAGS
jgi:hypothetical protein